ncbi:MAG: alpha/beta hydrolase [Planctomycetes bacterium]|nr:alpha/beta hydrolase [Planctomycetota bacterium]
MTTPATDLLTTTPVLERATAVLLGERVAYATLDLDPASVPALYVHGLGSDLTDLADLATLAGVPAALLDLPGFGRSERVDRAHSVARDAAVCCALLDHLGLERALWVGCSYGGHVALRAALDHPARVAGLVLVSSGGLHLEPPVHLAPLFDEHVMAARPPAAVAAACEVLAATKTPATARLTARRVAAHVGLPFEGRVVARDYKAVARSARAALEDDAGRRLHEVEVPVEVVHGALDPLVPLPVAEAAAARLKRATLTTLSGAGHVPWLEAPAPVAARVRRALARLDD